MLFLLEPHHGNLYNISSIITIAFIFVYTVHTQQSALVTGARAVRSSLTCSV